MVNSKRWSWSGAPRKAQTREDAVPSNQPLIPPSTNSDSCEASVPADKNLQPDSAAAAAAAGKGAGGGGGGGGRGDPSRRLSKRNRWSWRPDTAISVTLEDQRESEQGETQDGEPSQGQEERARPASASAAAPAPAPATTPRRLSKRNKKAYAARSSRPRPLSMFAPASSSFGAPPSFSHLESRLQQLQQDDQPQPSPVPSAQPSTGGVKHVFSRILSRRFSKRLTKKPPSQPVQQDQDQDQDQDHHHHHHHHQQQQQQGEAAGEPTPPPSQHQQGQEEMQEKQQQQTSGPIQQPSMRRGPQLHNPQNTLRGAPLASPVPSSSPVTTTNPATHAHAHVPAQNPAPSPAQGRIAAAALPGLDEQAELQLPLPLPPSTTTRPATAPVAATSLGSETASSSAAAPSAEETGFLGRLMRRRLASKDKDGPDNKKRSVSTGGDDTSQQPIDNTRPDPIPNLHETTEHETQAKPLPLSASQPSHKKANAVSDTSSSVPRFLRHAAKPQQATPSPGATQPPTGFNPWKPRSQSLPHSQPQQHMASTSAAQPKLRTKPSLGKRFWSLSSANDFGDDEGAVTNTNNNTKAAETPASASAPRAVYVPKHAASDFSRTAHNQRNHRHSFSLGSDRGNGVRPLATIAADDNEDEGEEPQSQPQPPSRPARYRTLSTEKSEKRRSREIPSSKCEGPSPQELRRRLEIIKSSEIEVVTTREAATTDSLQQQYNLLQSNSNASSSVGKAAAAKPQSRPRSTNRHSFNLVADPYARDLTPPKSVSPVEMEAPFDLPSQTAQQAPEEAPQQASQQAPEHEFQQAPQQPAQQAPQQLPQRATPAPARYKTRPKTQPQERTDAEMTDYERFIADAEVAERDYHAQMWRNLARRSGHYGYSENIYTSFRPDPVSVYPAAANGTAHRSNRRDSAYYSVGKRASMISTGTNHSGVYGQTGGGNGGVVDGSKTLKHQASISRRIADYIKPPKQSQEPTYEDWLAPAGRANRRSIVAGVAEE